MEEVGEEVGQEASFPQGNAAKVKNQICISTWDRKVYGYQAACESIQVIVHSQEMSERQTLDMKNIRWRF